MKIKSIDTFTLEECQQFIAENPNSSDMSEVIKRMNYLLNNQVIDTTDIEYEEFLVKLRRLTILQNYHDAFLLVLSMLRSCTINRKDEIYRLGIKMLETNIRKIWTYKWLGGGYELKFDYDYGCCNVDWLIDRAIESQFAKVRIIPTGVVIGRLPSYSWHRYDFVKKGESYTLRYRYSFKTPAQDIDKMLDAIGRRLIEEAIRSSK